MVELNSDIVVKEDGFGAEMRRCDSVVPCMGAIFIFLLRKVGPSLWMSYGMERGWVELLVGAGLESLCAGVEKVEGTE